MKSAQGSRTGVRALTIIQETKLRVSISLQKTSPFFGAPVGLFFAIDRQMEPGQWANLGMYMQSIMLLARRG
jgi:hypothetical protein